MQISHEFDLSNRERQKRLFNARMQTSEKLVRRIKHFFKEVDNNYSLSKGQKNKIKTNLKNQL